MNEKNLINYYNKFNEDKRLNTRHGIIEFNTTIHFIEKYLKSGDIIADIGAGTGKYSGYFSNKGYEVHAVELVKHNMRLIEKNYSNVNVYQGNALNLKMFKDNTFDIVLLFGPMYHLITKEEKVKALNEAKRIVKKDGFIFVVYIMNDYAILKHGFLDNYLFDNKNKINKDFNIIQDDEDLYSYVTIDEINDLNSIVNLKRIEIITQDGLTDYFRKDINNMSDELFNEYLRFHLKTCDKKENLGYSSHLLDILKK